MLLNGEIEPKIANAILYGCNISLSAIRIDEQQAQLEKLEEQVKELSSQYVRDFKSNKKAIL